MKNLLLTCIILMSLNSYAQNWSQIVDFSSSARDDGASFKIGNKVYCGTGRNAGFNVTGDFRAFDLSTETWSTIASLPDTARRQYAASWTYNGEGYIFSGIDQNGNYLQDLWKYTPTTDTWSFVSFCQNYGRTGSNTFVLGDKTYIVGGNHNLLTPENELLEFDMTNLTWDVKNNIPGLGMWRGVAFEYDTTAFIGLGLNSVDALNEQFYHYLPSTDQWQPVPQLVTNPRSYVNFAQIGDSVYMYGGVDTNGVYVNSFERINIPSLTIDNLTPFPSDGRKGCMAFTSSNNFYITTGITTTARLKETWVARKVVGLEEPEISASVILNGSELTIMSDIAWMEIEIISLEGKTVLKEAIENQLNLDVSFLQPGMFFYRLTNETAETKGRVFLGD